MWGEEEEEEDRNNSLQWLQTQIKEEKITMKDIIPEIVAFS